ncbi:trypsin-like peptidase domain-containing protein [Nanoarchaeota archaeon]
MRSDPQRQAKRVLFLSLLILVFTLGYLLYSVHTLGNVQLQQIMELEKGLYDIKIVVQQEMESFKQSQDYELNEIQGLVVDAQQEYDKKAEELEQLVELTEHKSGEQLEELRRELKDASNTDFTTLVNEVVSAAVSVTTDDNRGSGAVITKSGYIITNYHVVKGFTKATVIDYDGQVGTASVIASDPVRDLALLKTDITFSKRLEFGNSDNIIIGERVIAVGSPAGLDFSVTQGIVSNAHREFSTEEGHFIQTDVPINKGSSGSPLIDSTGKLIGINTFKLKGQESLGFAIPSNAVKKFFDSSS